MKITANQENQTPSLIVKIFIGIGCLVPVIPIIIMMVFYALPKEDRHYYINVTGNWKIHEGSNPEWLDIHYDDSRWKDMKLPGKFYNSGFKQKHYTIRKKIIITEKLMNEDLFFIAGRTQCITGNVYFNAHKIGRIGSSDHRLKIDGITSLSGFPIDKRNILEKENILSIEFQQNTLKYDGIIDPRMYLGEYEYIHTYFQKNVFLNKFFQYGTIIFSIFMLILLGILMATEWKGKEIYKYVSTSFLVLSILFYNMAFSGAFFSFSMHIFSLLKLLHCSIFFIGFAIMEFVPFYFMRRINIFSKINRIICTSMILSYILIDNSIILNTIYSYFIYYLFGLFVYLTYIAIKYSIFKKTSPYSIMVAVAVILAIGTGVSDLLTNLELIDMPAVFSITISSFSIIVTVVVMADFININMTNKKLTASLKELNLHLEEKVEERTVQLKKSNDELQIMNKNLAEMRNKLWGEMQLAKKIQTVLLPEKPSIPGYSISTYMKPADDVGGDYYDIINVNGLDWLVIGDVSGHGVSAGLVMMMVQTCIHNTLNIHSELSPSEILTIINRTIYNNLKKMNEDKYMTISVFAAHKDGKFTFSGLHLDVIIYRNSTGKIEIVNTSGIWIGIMDNIHNMLKNDTFTLELNDSMLIYTDGIIEAWKKGLIKDHRSMDCDMFGIARLQEVFTRVGHMEPEEIKNGVLSALKEYDLFDDITLVVLKRI